MYIGSSVILLLGDLLCIIFFKYKYKRDSIRSSPDSIILVLVIIGTIISIIVGISVSPDKLINIFFIFLGSYAIIFTTWFSYKFVEEQVKSAANLGYYLSLLKKEKTLLARLMTVSRMFEADSAIPRSRTGKLIIPVRKRESSSSPSDDSLRGVFKTKYNPSHFRKFGSSDSSSKYKSILDVR